MISFKELKTEIKEIQKQTIEVNKKESTDALKIVKLFCKKFGSTVGLKGFW